MRTDEESLEWLRRLRSDGDERAAAIEELRELLLRAARFEVQRRLPSLPFLRGEDYGDLAEHSANDALLAVLGKLSSFRGDSRFTTWAYKFALLEAAVKLRCRAWQDRELPAGDDLWSLIADAHASPDEQVELSDLLLAVGKAIEEDLTPHQRKILVALTLNGVPIDVLADRLQTTRGAIYKTLHDARGRLRSRLLQQGLRIGSGNAEAS
jgi:RNA polymerase sigma-70 factor, ECF subfamily